MIHLTSNLPQIPNELLVRISSFVIDPAHFSTLTNLFLVCKRWRQAFLEEQETVLNNLRKENPHRQKFLPFFFEVNRANSTRQLAQVNRSIAEYLNENLHVLPSMQRPIHVLPVFQLDQLARKIQTDYLHPPLFCFFAKMFTWFPEHKPLFDFTKNPNELRKWLIDYRKHFDSIQTLPEPLDMDIPEEVGWLSFSAPVFISLFETAVRRKNYATLERLAQNDVVCGLDLSRLPYPLGRISAIQLGHLLQVLKDNHLPKFYALLVRTYKNCTVPKNQRIALIANVIIQNQYLYLAPWLMRDWRLLETAHDALDQEHNIVLARAFQRATPQQIRRLFVHGVQSIEDPCIFSFWFAIRSLFYASKPSAEIGGALSAALLASFDVSVASSDQAMDAILKNFGTILGVYEEDAAPVIEHILFGCSANEDHFPVILGKVAEHNQQHSWEGLSIGLTQLISRLMQSEEPARKTCAKILLKHPIAKHIREKILGNILQDLVLQQDWPTIQGMLTNAQLNRISVFDLRRATKNIGMVQAQPGRNECLYLLESHLQSRSACIIL